MDLFDTNAHPDEAVRRGLIGSYGEFAEQARALGWTGACAVALPATDPRSHIAACHDDTEFYFPVAPWLSEGPGSTEARLQDLVELGYRAVKIHPRLGGPSFASDEFRQVARHAAVLDVTLFICTYPFGAASQTLGDRILSDLELAMAENPRLRMVLLHGGGPDLLRYAEFARANRDALLVDLSLTIMKYRGSSIDLDIAFLMANFDLRISVGSDYPWYSPAEVSERVDYFINQLDAVRRMNVLGESARSFLKHR